MSLGQKLLLPFLALLGGLLLLIHFFWLPSYLEDEAASLLQREAEHLDLAGTNLLSDLLGGDLARVYENLDAIRATHGEWELLTLHDHQGIRLYPLQAPPAQKAEELTWIERELTFNGSPAATLAAGLDLETLLQAKRRSIQELEVSLIVIVLAAIMVNALLQYLWIVHPLQHLAQAVDNIASGRFDAPLPRPTNDEIGRFNRSFGIMRSRLQERQEALSASERRLDAIIRNCVEAIITIDVRGTVQSFNKAAQEVFGYAEEDVLGRNVAMLMPPEIAKIHDSFLQRYQNENRPQVIGQIREVVGLRKNGETFPAWLAVSAVDLPDGRIFVGSLLDITEQKKAQEELQNNRDNLQRSVEERTRDLIQARDQAQAANKAKSAFLANMSHEIRTPMNAIINMNELALYTGLDEEQRDYIETARSAAQRLLGIINEILDFSRIESGRLELQRVPFNLVELLQELVTSISPLAQSKGLELRLEAPPDMHSVYWGDPVKLGQVFTNLLHNAVKFTSEGGVLLQVSLLEPPADEPATALLRFEVQDSGIGIAPQVLPTIFAPFTQGDGSITRHFGGTGLGLAIATQLVELMGGELGVQSAPGEGATFHCSLRLQQASVEDLRQDSLRIPADANEQDLPRASQPKRVLLVEDTPENQKVARSLLLKLGHELEVADNGEEALRMLRESAYDIVLMDLEMPVMDGLEATRRIRSGEAGKAARGLEIVALTAHALAGYRERCQEAGMDGFITKPFSLQQLAQLLQPQDADTGRPLAPASSSLPRLNREAALERFGGDESLYEEVSQMVLHELEEKMRQMQELCASASWEGLAFLVHSVKSNLATLGAERAQAIAQRLEEAAKAEKAEDVEQALHDLGREMKSLQRSH